MTRRMEYRHSQHRCRSSILLRERSQTQKVTCSVVSLTTAVGGRLGVGFTKNGHEGFLGGNRIVSYLWWLHDYKFVKIHRTVH